MFPDDRREITTARCLVAHVILLGASLGAGAAGKRGGELQDGALPCEVHVLFSIGFLSLLGFELL